MKRMKRILAVLIALAVVFAFAACDKTDQPAPAAFDPNLKSEGVMSYADYVAAPVDSEVTVEGFVQAVQSYWGGAKLYLQDGDGAYFVYAEGNEATPNITEADYSMLVDSTAYSDGWTGLANGTKVQVKGWKSEWKGEIEITESTVTLVDSDVWKAEALDVTEMFGNEEELIKHQNEFISVKGAKVLAKTDAAGAEAAFLYNWDGSGQKGGNPDLYFDLEIGGQPYTFTVESYLCYQGSDVYTAVENLQIGDTVDVEGFLYWYAGANPHITALTVNAQ